jgi:hypothetical protein
MTATVRRVGAMSNVWYGHWVLGFAGTLFGFIFIELSVEAILRARNTERLSGAAA